MAESDDKKDEQARNNRHNDKAAKDGLGFDILLVIIHCVPPGKIKAAQRYMSAVSWASFIRKIYRSEFKKKGLPGVAGQGALGSIWECVA